MSRAIFVNMTEADVLAMCAKHEAVVSASEPLPAGGTRVVFSNGDAAAAMRAIFGGKVMERAAARTPFAMRQSL